MSLSVVRTHGTNGGYVRGCRCEACRKAHREYEAAHRKAKADPDSGYIAADRARAHLLVLAEHGLGVGAVNVATDIIPSIIIGIRNGKRTRLQKRTEKKILAVTPDLALDHALVDAAPTWRRIHEMLAAGTPESVILAALDRTGPITRLGRSQVTVRTAALIERLHTKLSPVVPDNVRILAVPPEQRRVRACRRADFSQIEAGHPVTLSA